MTLNHMNRHFGNEGRVPAYEAGMNRKKSPSFWGLFYRALAAHNARYRAEYSDRVGIAVWSAAPPCSPDDLPLGEPTRTVKFGRPPLHVHLGRCEAKVKARIGDAYPLGTHRSSLEQSSP
jgi:hypothetical protein